MYLSMFVWLFLILSIVYLLIVTPLSKNKKSPPPPFFHNSAINCFILVSFILIFAFFCLLQLSIPSDFLSYVCYNFRHHLISVILSVTAFDIIWFLLFSFSTCSLCLVTHFTSLVGTESPKTPFVLWSLRSKYIDV